MILTDRHMLDCYHGTGGCRDGSYLIQHTRETAADYARRKAYATWRGYPRKVVDAYVGTLFSAPPQRTGEAAAWAALQSDADGIGGSLESVMQPAQVLAMLLGTVYLIVDRPPGVSRTRADDLGRMPYIVTRLPADVVALTLDPRGRITRLVCQEYLGGRSYGAAATLGLLVYRGWDASRWWLSLDLAGADIVEVDGMPQTGEHGLGRVPAIRLHSTILTDRCALRAEPWAAGIVDAALDLYNRMSEARAIERDQTVSTLALPVSDPNEADRIRETGLTVGASNAVLYNPTGGGRPDYFAPPADPLTQLYAGCEANRQDIYALANLEFVGGVQMSGVAVSYHHESYSRTLTTWAAALSVAETELARIACQWMGEDPSGCASEYPSTFEVQDLAARLAEDQDALGMQLGETAERLIRGRAARRVLGDAATPEEYGQIDAELQAGVDPYQDRVAAAGVIPPDASGT